MAEKGRETKMALPLHSCLYPPVSSLYRPLSKVPRAPVWLGPLPCVCTLDTVTIGSVPAPDCLMLSSDDV